MADAKTVPVQSEPEAGVTLRRVEVRSWPQNVDVRLIDPQSGVQLAHFPLDDAFQGPCFDPYFGYADRAADALARLETDQRSLREWYQLNEAETVRIEADETVRGLLAAVLDPFGLELEQIELCYLVEDWKWIARIATESQYELYELLCNWVDVAEHHYPAGSLLSANEPHLWVENSKPENACCFHYVAGVAKGEHSEDAAYARFLSMVDVPLADFTFGHLLRYLYYHLTEFYDRRPPQPRALAELVARG